MLFNEAACFSMRVPKETIQTWLTHGGRIYPGGTTTVARKDEWTSILCRRPDGFDAGLPFSRMGIQDHTLASVVSPRYPQRVSRPFVPRSQLQTPPCILPEHSPAYPNALHSESGDSLLRRPRKCHMLAELSSSSAESSCDIAITEVHNSAVTKRNHDTRSTHVVTPDMCVANTPPDNPVSSAPRHLTPSFKAMSKYKSQGHEKAGDLNLNYAYERTSEFTLTANGTSPVACPKDSPPVPAIDFTRLQFPSRNSLRFPLLRLEPVTTAAKVGSRGEGENSARPPAASNHTPNRFAQDAPGACSSRNHEDTEAALPVTRQDTKRATALWESNAMWKGMRFWHEDLKKPTWNADADMQYHRRF
ncbi:hypothetical protein DFJ58DRAFT_823646 [Suillus subalutaceus]|uniref:uncharacterized protein n=1 Tax=Suillus subalutaceus TaxID=48586 RepID=UPI001B879EF5|nr:uncharacterized protein DFJ58DRAFT_823646 [Suillus subalutaceus]KAG1831922.1 hypothetical protein DFJ58DRAFT_823646 [Suillus subalutaceus]